MLPLPITNHLLCVDQGGVCNCYPSSIFTMQMSSVKLLVILVGFSYVVSATAVPATRTQNLKREDASSVPSLPEVDAVKLGNGTEELQLQVDVEEEGFMERRMDLQTQDYGGTGANKDHDPKSPGTV